MLFLLQKNLTIFRSDLEKMSRVQKSETKPSTRSDAFKFDNIPTRYRKQFFKYLTDYVLRDQNNVLLLQQALNAYYAQTHLHDESSFTSMNDMFNSKDFWEYFISTYFIQNEYLKLLLRKYQRKNIHTENDIILRATMGNLYHPEQITSVRTFHSDVDIINLKNLMYNINLNYEKRDDPNNNQKMQSKDHQSFNTESFNKFVSKWKQYSTPSRYRSLYKLVDDIYLKLEAKLDRYNTMFHHDTLTFLSKRQKKMKEEKKQVCSILIHLIYQNYVEGKEDISSLKQTIKKRLNHEFIANASQTLQFLMNNSLEQLVISILKLEELKNAQHKRKTEEEQFPVPSISPLLLNYSNENLMSMTMRANKEFLSQQLKPIIQRQHLQECIDQMLKEHLTHSLRFADPFIYDIHKNLHESQ